MATKFKSKNTLKKATKSQKRKPNKAKAEKTELELSYEKYYAKAKRRLDRSDVMDINEFATAMAGERAKGRVITEADLIQRQKQDGYTEAEMLARWNAHQRLFPDKFNTFNQFINGRGWEDLDDLHERLIEERERKGLNADPVLVFRMIISPEIGERI